MAYWDEPIVMVHSFSGERVTVPRRDETMYEVMGYQTLESTVDGVVETERAAAQQPKEPPVAVGTPPAPKAKPLEGRIRVSKHPDTAAPGLEKRQPGDRRGHQQPRESDAGCSETGPV